MSDGVYKISTLAKLTGFGIQAIRNWELRYGLLCPERTDGGHRLYSESDLRSLLRVKELLDQGRTISEVAGLLSKESSSAAASPKLDASMAVGVLNAVPHGIVLTDAQGKTEWINQGLTELCGYTLAELEGRTPGSVLQGKDTDRKAVRRISKALAARSPCREQVVNYDSKKSRLRRGYRHYAVMGGRTISWLRGVHSRLDAARHTLAIGRRALIVHCRVGPLGGRG